MTKLTTFLRQCVSSPLNIIITAAILVWLIVALPHVVDWAVINAVWTGASPRACADVDAACWIFIRAYGNQFIFGNYPIAEHWRVILCAIVGVAGLALLASPWCGRKLAIALVLVVGYPVFAGILLCGGILGLVSVPTLQWGGMLLTLVIAIWTILSAIPLGLLLMLGRRSKLPVLARLAAVYIDVMRGLPLVGILFVAIVLFPLFIPPGVEVNVLARILIAFMLFNAANMAEVFRGGVQSIAQGQYEAAAALGLGYWRVTAFVILPQTIRASLPGVVNISISIVKETTIVLIAGMFDFLGVVQNALVDPQWLVGDQVRQSAYFFIGLVFFVVCFGLSRYSAHIERRLAGTIGHARRPAFATAVERPNSP